MAMAITKNRQSVETIRRMAHAAFPQKEMEDCTELTEGMCNAAYLVGFTDGSKSVLKIASGSGAGLMSNEVNMMEAEVRAMRLVEERSAVKVARVEYYDTSQTLCDGPWFFMEALEGQSLFSIREGLSEEEKRALYGEIGEIEKAVCSIEGRKFGLLADDEHRFDSLFDFVFYLISNALTDSERKKVEIGVSPEEILCRLKADRAAFDEVTQPVLVHWDMWEGNIFVDKGHVCGVIDWERALWGEAYQDDRFRRHTRNRDFLKGYGQENFTEKEMRRIYWYDIFLYLTMMNEVFYREYEDDGQYWRVKLLFEASWNELNREKAV